MALARHVEIGEGGRVLFRPLAAAALGLGLGVGFGMAFAASAIYAGVQVAKHRPHLPQLPWRS